MTGFELGADDYVAKPFDLEELLARIQSVLRRALPKRTQPLSPEVELGSRPKLTAGARSVIRLLCVDPQPVALQGLTTLIAK